MEELTKEEVRKTLIQIKTMASLSKSIHDRFDYSKDTDRIIHTIGYTAAKAAKKIINYQSIIEEIETDHADCIKLLELLIDTYLNNENSKEK